MSFPSSGCGLVLVRGDGGQGPGAWSAESSGLCCGGRVGWWCLTVHQLACAARHKDLLVSTRG